MTERRSKNQGIVGKRKEGLHIQRHGGRGNRKKTETNQQKIAIKSWRGREKALLAINYVT